MKLRKSALTSLVLGLALIGSACESESPTPPPPVPTISITPSAPITLGVGQQATVSGVVTGLTTNAVTYSSSVPAVATVDANTGVVTAQAPGTTTITAQSTEQANLRASVQVTVVEGPGGGEPVPPTLSISRITQGGTNFPVNINNVAGQIDVVLNVEVPEGNAVDAINVTFTQDGETIVRPCQTFTGGSASALSAAGAAQAEIVCSYDTGAYDPETGEPAFTNGPVIVSGQIVMADGEVVNANNQITIILNNANFISATPEWSRGCANSEATGVAPAGSRWCAGDLTLDLFSVNYDDEDFDVTEVTVAITTSGQGANGICAGLADDGAGDTDPDCAPVTVSQTDNTAEGNDFQVVFAGGTGVTTTAANDIAGFEDIVTITVNSITLGGEAGPVCINPDPAANPQNTTCAAFGGNTAFFATPVRIDNLAPRVTLFDITPTTLGCDQSACFVNEEFEFSADNDDLIVLEDWGVDAQTADFFAGTSSTTLAQIQTGVEGFDETVTPTLILQARAEDKLDNTRSVYASTTGTAQTSATGAQRFGIDVTNPTIEGLSPDLDGDTDNDATAENVSVEFEDAGTGPSGFGDEPLVVTIEQILADGTTCYDDAGVEIDCDDAPVTSDASITIPDMDGYWRITVFVEDEAGNQSDTETFLFLDDETAPVVAGVVAPSTINGGTEVEFSADASDNVELGDVLAAIGYGGLGYYAHEGPETIDTYGVDSFTTETNASFTYEYFIHQLEPTAAGAPTGAAQQANAANFAVRDVAGVELGDPCPAPGVDGAETQNCTQRQNNNIQVNVQAGEGTTPTPWSTVDPDLVSWTLTTNEPAPDVSAGESSTFSAVATGPQGTFAEPFEFVNFYEQNASGRWILVGQDLTGTATDDDIQNIRMWTYTFSITPDDDGETHTVRAIGVNSGAGLISNDVTITSVP